MTNIILDNDTLFIFALILLSGLESLDTYISITLGVVGIIFGIVKTIDIIRNWKNKKKKK